MPVSFASGIFCMLGLTGARLLVTQATDVVVVYPSEGKNRITITWADYASSIQMPRALLVRASALSVCTRGSLRSSF